MSLYKVVLCAIGSAKVERERERREEKGTGNAEMRKTLIS